MFERMTYKRGELEDRSYRVGQRVVDYLVEQRRRQTQTTIRVLREIQQTGDSVEFSPTLSELDNLASIPMAKLKTDEKSRMREVVGALGTAFGPSSVQDVYSEWKAKKLASPNSQT